MLIAIAFVVSGAIGAIPGGLLAAEVELEQAPAAATRDDLLPGVSLLADEVTPGVYRVASDGIRDLSRPADDADLPLGGVLDDNIVAGLDGSVWWFGPEGYFRLGADESHVWRASDREDRVLASEDLEVAPDGTLWRATDSLSSFDGQTWVERGGGRSISGVEVQDDGSVWSAWRNPRTGRVKRAARLTDDGWDALPGRAPSVRGDGSERRLAVSSQAGGGIWLVGSGLHRHDGDGWQRVAPPRGSGEVERGDVGPDGTVWIRLRQGVSTLVSTLARFDGLEWVVYDQFWGIPGMGDHYQGFEGWFEVAPDGSLWFNPIGDFARTGTECDGVANFDGDSLTYYLRDTCIYAMDVAPDGSVWVQAGEPILGEPLEDGLVHTYVIRPTQAAAATG